jgi:deazaflavin-dependent oxidoreductase (nitroreductase family)
LDGGTGRGHGSLPATVRSMTEQKVEQVWETPSLDEIPVLSKAHVGAMETMDDDVVWVQAGMHHVLLRTIGRKSGNEHKVALPIWRDPEGNRVVVASFAGAPGHPSWYLNLSDRKANPEVLCRVQGGQEFWSTPEILEGDEYDRIWALLNADRAWYDNYQAKTDRQIPLVRLPETRPA